VFPRSYKARTTINEQARIIDTGERLTLAASLDALHRQPNLIDEVVAALFDAPQRRAVEVIIDRPARASGVCPAC